MAIAVALVVAAILGGVSIGILAILAIGIHSNGQSTRLSNLPRTYAESVVRKILGMTVRTSNPSHSAPEED
jgi:hypothetical protein